MSTARARGRVVYLDVDGTLTGPGGALFTGEGGSFTYASLQALELLREHEVPYVLVSGRSLQRLATTARLLGADGALAEMGAIDCGYPTAEGQSVFDAIRATGIPEALLERETDLYVHPAAGYGRDGSHLFLGRVGVDAARWVEHASNGTLRLADNGGVDEKGTHVFHLLPTNASKAAAVRTDLARRDADPSRCLAVGDSGEDLGMADVVGHFALTRNGVDAHPELASRATWVTNARYGDGCLEAVTAWLGSTG